MRGLHAGSMSEIAGAGRAVPEPELGAGSVKIRNQHFQHASGKVFSGAAERSHGGGEGIHVIFALRLCLYQVQRPTETCSAGESGKWAANAGPQVYRGFLKPPGGA